MKNLICLIFICAVSILTTTTVHAGYIEYYKDSSGKKYGICQDRDGTVVYKPNGGQDSHGKGYSKQEVKKQYNLKSKRVSRSSKFYSTCP